jgi:hypothetical protein
MAEITLRLQVDRSTGKKNIIISYRSDESALPMEHEQEHRALVDKLIQGGTLKAAELGRVVVERESSTPAGEQQKQEEEAAQERAALKQ